MPEGDTVYQAARRLNASLAGAVLRRCELRVPRFAAFDATGERVDEVVSRGKHLLIRVGEYSIHSHLKMEGAWHVYRRGAKWARPAFQARAVLETADVTAVGFELGLLDVVDRAHEDEVVGYLGPDLLGPPGAWPGWNAADAIARIEQHPDTPIAVALLDQRNLAGLGNVYANELCFLRGVLPTRPVADVDIPAMVDLSHRVIVANKDRMRRVTTGNSRPGKATWVYGREGKPCLRCGTPITRIDLGRTETELRNTYFCSHCQT